MEDYILNFKEKTSLNKHLFYSKVVNSFQVFIDNFQTCNFIIDFTNVIFIEPCVLPKLCCLGYKLKDKYGITPQIIIDWSSSLLSYLSSIGFFKVIQKYDIFYVDDRILGGFQETKATNAFIAFDRDSLLQKSSEIFIFDNNLSEKDRLKGCIDNELFGFDRKKSSVLNILSNLIKDMEYVDEIALDFLEIIHNAVWHGNGVCFFSLQACTYKKSSNTTFSKVQISISDMGDGIYETMSNKNWEMENRSTSTIDLNTFLLFADKINKNYFSILEALLYRKKDIIKGLYHVLINLKNKNDCVLEVLNENVWLFLNRRLISNILSLEGKDLPPYLKEINTNYKNKGKNPFLDVKENFYGGLHIDMSFTI